MVWPETWKHAIMLLFKAGFWGWIELSLTTGMCSVFKTSDYSFILIISLAEHFSLSVSVPLLFNKQLVNNYARRLVNVQQWCNFNLTMVTFFSHFVTFDQTSDKTNMLWLGCHWAVRVGP